MDTQQRIDAASTVNGQLHPAVTNETATAVTPDLTAEQFAAILAQTKETHRLVIEWVRSFDVKIGPILTAAAALFAVCIELLGQQALALSHRPATHIVVALTLLPLLYSVLMAVSAVSPSLKLGRWGMQRHRPHAHGEAPTSVIFFGQIAQYHRAKEYADAAKAVFADNTALLDELLEQTYINAKIAENKGQHIALAARGLFAAVILLILGGLIFTLGR